MRKAKGQTVAIVVLILLAAVLLNLWLMLSTDYSANFDRYHDKLNAEHVTVTVNDENGEVYDYLLQTLVNEEKVSEFCLDKCMHMTATFPYNGGELSSWFVFMPKDMALTRSVGKVEIVEEGKYTSGVYIPMIYKTNDIEVGKPIKLFIGSHSVEYTVCGFFNSVMAGSHNCGLTLLVFSEDKYTELENLGYAPKSTICSVRLHDKSENLNFEATIKSDISKRFPNVSMVSNSYAIVLQARYISQMICSGIISAMAFFVLMIAIVVIVSNIVNYIQINIKNLGALKASGYTSRQLISSLLLQFLGLTAFATIVGTGVSYAIFPSLNKMMIDQTGIPYEIKFLPLPILITLAILCFTVMLAVLIASHKIKKIEPIVALRAGVQTHNFKRNHVPLEKTRVSLNLALALKTTLSGIKHNITVFITILFLSLVVVFSGVMTANMISDITPFLNLIVGEMADSCISINVEAEDKFLDEMKSDSRVEKAYLYTTINVTHVDGAELLTTICDDFSKVNNPNIIYDGRFPKYENEIAIGAKYAKERGFHVGNEIEITSNGKTEKYIISGLTQITNYLGRDGLLTRSGYERIGSISHTSYYINLADETDIDLFNAEMKEKFSDKVNTTINVDATIKASATVYVSMMTIIVIAILVLSAIIITFVLFLLVRTMLNNKKRDYGILKALGFTTKQLVLQTALTFMPAIIISTIFGIAISSVTVNPLLSLFFGSLGVLKCTFTVPVVFITIAGIGLVLLSFAMACLLSLRVKKIDPRALLVGE